tara:strand:- start:3370 stop:4191 length:822 start_codon:yes stop_codon:yes gene_type:complete
MVDVEVYDNLISPELHHAMYDVAQTMSWYCKWITVADGNLPIQEYIPEQANSSSKHILGAETTIEDMIDLFRFSMYRHPIGWDTDSIKHHCKEAYNIFESINNQLFDGKASLDHGLKEAITGISGPKSYYINEQSYYDKYGVPWHKGKEGFTCYLNGRSTDPMNNDRIGGRSGQMHQDSGPFVEPDDPYYTVLFVLNKVWQPDWGGELTFFNDDDTGSKHWKRGYNLGWPEKVVGNKAGRIIVYKHNTTHMSNPPRVSAPEITQRLAFRIKVV